MVRNPSGVPIADVTVTAITTFGKGIDEYESKKKTRTSTDGRYAISLSHAVYTIYFSKDGYQKAAYRIMTRTDRDTIIEVVLKPK
jgi:hypothetical protein